MAFSELSFILIILPVFVFMYNAACPRILRPILLIFGSLAIYYVGFAFDPPVNIVSAAALPTVMLFTWICSYIIEKSRSGQKGVLGFSVTVLAAVLVLSSIFCLPFLRV